MTARNIPPKPALLLSLLFATALPGESQAAALMFDSFDQGGFALTLENPASDNVVDLPLARNRFSSINSRQAETGTVMVSTLTTDTGVLRFAVNGGSNSVTTPLGLTLTYSQGGPYSIAGSTGLLFRFSQMIGAGSLVVFMGSGAALDGPDTHRIPLNESGEVFYPIADINLGTSGNLDSFLATQIRFEANTPEFSFTLDEIRLVPEPSSLLIILSTGVCLLHRRRRGWETVG